MSRYLSPVTFILSLLGIPLILFSLPVEAFAAGDSIVMNLEEPAAGSTYSGVANVRGWAVAPQGLEKVELYVDDQFFSNLPLGGRRADVGNAYPNYPGSAQSGFAMAFNYSNLTAGPHTFTVRAIDAAGGGRDARVTANVVRFEQTFMADPAAVNVDQASLAWIGNTITVENLVADGKLYNIQLDWRPAAQDFSITEATPAGTSSGRGDVCWSMVWTEDEHGAESDRTPFLLKVRFQYTGGTHYLLQGFSEPVIFGGSAEVIGNTMYGVIHMADEHPTKPYRESGVLYMRLDANSLSGTWWANLMSFNTQSRTTELDYHAGTLTRTECPQD